MLNFVTFEQSFKNVRAICFSDGKWLFLYFLALKTKDPKTVSRAPTNRGVLTIKIFLH